MAHHFLHTLLYQQIIIYQISMMCGLLNSIIGINSIQISEWISLEFRKK